MEKLSFSFPFFLFLFLFFYVFQLLLDSRSAQVFSFYSSGGAEQYIGRQSFYGELFHKLGIPAGKVTCLLPFQGVCFNRFLPIVFIDV